MIYHPLYNFLRALLGLSHWKWIPKTHWEMPANLKGQMQVWEPGRIARLKSFLRNRTRSGNP